MKKTDCSVVRDLLPLYIDDVCGAESKLLVEEHLKQCKECTAEKAKMTGEIELPKDTGIKALMNIEIKISKKVKLVFVALGSLLLGVVIAVVAGSILSSYQIPVDYEDLDGNFTVLKQGNDFTIVSQMNEHYGLIQAEEYLGEDENGMNLLAVYVGYTTTPIIELQKEIATYLSYLSVNEYDNERTDWLWSTGQEAWKPIARIMAIYYLPLDSHGEMPAELPADKSEAVLIWSEEGYVAE